VIWVINITAISLLGYSIGAANALTNIVPPVLGPCTGGALFSLGSTGLAVVATARVRNPLFLAEWSFVAALVGGAVVAILLCDYYAVRGRELPREYMYRSWPLLHLCGVNFAAVLALAGAVGVFLVPQLLERVGSVPCS
jgi:cytosine/uracil/thiamine/allantoin permease